jgi:hypothetical protein
VPRRYEDREALVEKWANLCRLIVHYFLADLHLISSNADMLETRVENYSEQRQPDDSRQRESSGGRYSSPAEHGNNCVS